MLTMKMKMKMITMVINKDNIESRLGDVLSKCPGGANNGFDHNFVMANTEAPLNFVCRVSFHCHRHLLHLHLQHQHQHGVDHMN